MLNGPEATRQNVYGELVKNNYDILHYAGHADYDETNPGKSGLKCHDGMLVASDFHTIASLPQLIFLNGCESGRMRSQSSPDTCPEWAKNQLANITLAERLLMKSKLHFIGTYWDVGDETAMIFAQKFYDALLSGKPIGLAMQIGRTATHEIAGRDWANFQHFGDPAYRLRQP